MTIELQQTDNVDVILWAIAASAVRMQIDDSTKWAGEVAKVYKILNETQVNAKGTRFIHGK